MLPMNQTRTSVIVPAYYISVITAVGSIINDVMTTEVYRFMFMPIASSQRAELQIQWAIKGAPEVIDLDCPMVSRPPLGFL